MKNVTNTEKMKGIVTLSLTILMVGFGQSDAIAQSPKEKEKDHGHAHGEAPLGKFDIKGTKIEAKQGHGSVEPGKEGHLVIKLSYNDKGKTVIRAWIGTKDRTLSATGKGTYDSSHGNYHIHAIAPKPLPKRAKWWVEIEKPDGTKAVGSIPFLKNVKKH